MTHRAWRATNPAIFPTGSPGLIARVASTTVVRSPDQATLRAQGTIDQTASIAPSVVPQDPPQAPCLQVTLVYGAAPAACGATLLTNRENRRDHGITGSRDHEEMM